MKTSFAPVETGAAGLRRGRAFSTAPRRSSWVLPADVRARPSAPAIFPQHKFINIDRQLARQMIVAGPGVAKINRRAGEKRLMRLHRDAHQVFQQPGNMRARQAVIAVAAPARDTPPARC